MLPKFIIPSFDDYEGWYYEKSFSFWEAFTAWQKGYTVYMVLHNTVYESDYLGYGFGWHETKEFIDNILKAAAPR